MIRRGTRSSYGSPIRRGEVVVSCNRRVAVVVDLLLPLGTSRAFSGGKVMDGRGDATGKEGFWRFRTAAEVYETLPPPPYQVNNVHMNFVGVRFDPDAVRELLPTELEPVDENTGTICVYTVGSGWGIAPFTACFVAVEVKGFHAPDGSPGYYLATGYYSGRGYQMMHFNFNEHALEGGSRHLRDGDLAVGIAGPVGQDVLTIKTRPTENSGLGTGSRHYMGKRPQGGTNIFAIAYFGEMTEADPISVEITDAASDRMKLARPVELIHGADCHLSLTFGPPRSIAELGSAGDIELARASLLSVFSRIGRAAVLVNADGEISVINHNAELLLGDGIRAEAGRLRAVRSGDQRNLDRAVAAATDGDTAQFDLEPVIVERDGGRPLIVQAMPIDIAVTGRPSALILLNDPAAEPNDTPIPALQLLGLTPAEARIAELVGSGLSPREAAEKLDNSEGTVRTSLTRIYQKLDINRQSELARIVARL